ncbi:integrase, catalytic region, zinc finger, CCHC-type containing protein [Tanacetum coccineum]
MTGDRSRLRNFMKKFIGIVRFRNDHFGAIMGYGDYVIGDSVISRVYYVEGPGHNLFSVGQFYDSDMEVAFRKHSCYVRDTDDVELIKGSRGSNLYTISVEDMMKSSPICLLSKASKNKSWLWHRRLNHLNFGTINDLARKDLVREAARTMLIFSKAPMFLWAEAMATVLSLALFVTLTAKFLENYNQQMILEYSLVMHLAGNEPTRVERPVSPTLAVLVSITSAGTPSSTTIDQDAPSPSHSPSSLALQSPSLHQGIKAESTLMENNPFAHVVNDPFINVFDPVPSFEASSSRDLSSAESPYVTQTLQHLRK